MNNDSKTRFTDPDLWIRLIYMILFAALTWLSRLVLCVIGLLQFLVVLLSGAENRSLRDFSASLAEWTLRAFRFVCFNTEQKPFPFEEWPEANGSGTSAATAAIIVPPPATATGAADTVSDPPPAAAESPVPPAAKPAESAGDESGEDTRDSDPDAGPGPRPD